MCECKVKDNKYRNVSLPLFICFLGISKIVIYVVHGCKRSSLWYSVCLLTMACRSNQPQLQTEIYYLIFVMLFPQNTEKKFTFFFVISCSLSLYQKMETNEVVSQNIAKKIVKIKSDFRLFFFLAGI